VKYERMELKKRKHLLGCGEKKNAGKGRRNIRGPRGGNFEGPI